MACDLCGAKGTPLADLLDGYKTDDIKAVCPTCEKELNAKLWKIRAVLDGSMRTLLKRWMGERRAAAFAGVTARSAADVVQLMLDALCLARPDVPTSTWSIVQDAINAGRAYLAYGVLGVGANTFSHHTPMVGKDEQ